MAKTVFIIFPHQLFADTTLLKNEQEIYIVEEFLFFKQYKFHQQKLVFHRASMQYYARYLQQQHIAVHYIEATDNKSDIRELVSYLSQKNTTTIQYYDTCDNWLEKHLQASCASHRIKTIQHTSPVFINTQGEIAAYFSEKKKYFQTDFYIQQRKKLEILLDDSGKPVGGKWSYDADNRLKYPKGKTPPIVAFPVPNEFYTEANFYVQKNFASNYGEINTSFIYPTTNQESADWLQQFLEKRFTGFGEYEDAIVDTESILHHSVLTPMLNVGLLTPLQIITAAVAYAAKQEVPLNSVEGFIRQIIGWREFIRGVYCYKGTEERTKNFWGFRRKIPASFYNGTTGIEPVDATIKKVISTGYCHHIERLMILGNFMLLCEFDPDAVYQWFMELFIDAYDWVMVPNVYGMSQFADGGLMATKPYISGSSYVLKMSNYKKGPWCEIWDALFWHFMNKQRQFFLSNPRLGMLIATYDKMSEEKRAGLHTTAENYLNSLQG